ncbi:hypothetical protein [Paracoccus denitrificans]|jgi:hypothetical protein|nr:hypothetical protein [Paracoccus denitrificans]MBB4630189.1 hypothetical protein [Paracoccus denitrificans]MCU7431499.1 hypothetical protein [Paracoccus denitrificans]QAR26307.1 hypothetical protein EO213_08320 [Paracoccus denitrificans]UPV95229.1 hypothetical protein M0K93_01135 [Paracoccus denitrificans]WQO32714.1 hypothetical protein U0005_10305 [Paracoccus denitrificans]
MIAFGQDIGAWAHEQLMIRQAPLRGSDPKLSAWLHEQDRLASLVSETETPARTRRHTREAHHLGLNTKRLEQVIQRPFQFMVLTEEIHPGLANSSEVPGNVPHFLPAERVETRLGRMHCKPHSLPMNKVI